jgi:diadenosine tetraphosphatase ApaH/serine/threonine PP2A family protein phosphatase
MRIALFSDIHANREAFTACLNHAVDHGIDRQVFLGDYIGYGADPAWAVERVMECVARGAAAVLGNHDAAVIAPGLRMNPVAESALAWTRTQLSAEHRDFLAALPHSIIDEDRLYVHANARAPERWAYILSAADALQSLRASPVRLTFCGHVHVPALYHLGSTGRAIPFTPVAGRPVPLLATRRWLAVLGAVGQPRDGIPAAAYAVFDTDRCELTLLRVAYDIATAARKVRDAGLPALLSERLELGF